MFMTSFITCVHTNLFYCVRCVCLYAVDIQLLFLSAALQQNQINKLSLLKALAFV